MQRPRRALGRQLSAQPRDQAALEEEQSLWGQPDPEMKVAGDLGRLARERRRRRRLAVAVDQLSHHEAADAGAHDRAVHTGRCGRLTHVMRSQACEDVLARLEKSLGGARNRSRRIGHARLLQ